MSGGGAATTLSAEQRRRLAKLASLPDDLIDTSDIPEAPSRNWQQARRPNMRRALKQPVTIRLDMDVVAWFKETSGASIGQEHTKDNACRANLRGCCLMAAVFVALQEISR